MTKIRVYRPEDSLLIQQKIDAVTLQAQAKASGSVEDKYLAGPAVTILKDEQIAACCGIMLMGRKAGEVWLLPDNRLIGNPSVVKAIKIVFRWAVTMYDFSYITAVIPMHFPTERRFMEFMDFEEQGIVDVKGVSPLVIMRWTRR